jgi:hypothetical protein
MGCDECIVTALVDGEVVFVAMRFQNLEVLGTDEASLTTIYRCRRCGRYFSLGMSDKTPRELSESEARGLYPSIVRNDSSKVQ